MKQYPFAASRRNLCLFGLLMAALLMLSRDTMYGMRLLGFYPSQFLLLGILAIAGVSFLVVQRKQLKAVFLDPRMAAALAAGMILLLPMVVKRDWQMMYLSVLLCVLIPIFISYFSDLQQASRVFLTVLAALSAYSLLTTYFLRLLPDNGLLPVPVFDNNGNDFYNFGLSFVSLTYVRSRNFGIFREPGIHQFFLLLGLYLNNWRADWEKPWQTWTVNAILGLTMLSTFATGGLIELVLLVIFLFWDKKWYRSRKALLIAGGVILGIGALIGWVLLSKNALYEDMVGVFGKFSNEENDSGGSRVGAILTDLQIFLHHPIFGERLSEVLFSVQDNTTSTMIQYAAFGAVAGSLHVAGWAALTWDRNRCFLGNVILLVILFMAFNTQNLIANSIFWLFPILALTERCLPFLVSRIRNRRHAA